MDLLSQVQNDFCISGPSSSASGHFGSLARSQRRILARSDSGVIQKVPRFLHRLEEISVPCHALRPKQCPPFLYQTDEVNSQRTSSQGDSGAGLSRRLAYLGPVSITVHSGPGGYPLSHTKTGFPHQLGQVSSSSLSSVQLDRSSVAHAVCPSVRSPGHQDPHLTVSSLVPLPPSCVEEGFRESNGEALVRFHSGPHLQSSSQGSQFVSEGSRPGPSSSQEVSSTPCLHKFLREWFRVFPLRKRDSWRKPPPSFDVHTDALMSGWGFHTLDGQSRSGLWSPQFRRLHINILELATVYITINSLQLRRGAHIRVHCDNST